MNCIIQLNSRYSNFDTPIDEEDESLFSFTNYTSNIVEYNESNSYSNIQNQPETTVYIIPPLLTDIKLLTFMEIEDITQPREFQVAGSNIFPNLIIYIPKELWLNSFTICLVEYSSGVELRGIFEIPYCILTILQLDCFSYNSIEFFDKVSSGIDCRFILKVT